MGHAAEPLGEGAPALAREDGPGALAEAREPFRGISEATWLDVSARIRREVRRRAMFYRFRPGEDRCIPMALRPCVLSAEQRSHLRRLAWAAQSAALRMHRARLERADLRQLFPLSEGEERWMRFAYQGGRVRPETAVSRTDVVMDPRRPGWRRTARMLEVNLVGLGALYFSHCAGQIAKQLLAPLAPGARLEPEDDLLEMVIGECRRHGRLIGRPEPAVAMIERRGAEGPNEYEQMTRIYRSRGYRVAVADPTEVEARRGELFVRGEKVDVLYRDPTLEDLVGLEEAGHDVRGMRLAFRHNRVVSSLAGEVDHKSLLEIFSSPRYRALLTPAERTLLGAHVPWTRVVRQDRTEGPDGRLADLPELVRRRRAWLVLKPNRAYGGEGVHFGARETEAAWDRLISDALSHPARWVAQECVPPCEDEFPVARGGRVAWKRRFFVLGIHATRRRMATLGRMSEEAVVNITRGGAVVGVLEGRSN